MLGRNFFGFQCGMSARSASQVRAAKEKGKEDEEELVSPKSTPISKGKAVLVQRRYDYDVEKFPPTFARAFMMCVPQVPPHEATGEEVFGWTVEQLMEKAESCGPGIRSRRRQCTAATTASDRAVDALTTINARMSPSDMSSHFAGGSSGDCGNVGAVVPMPTTGSGRRSAAGMLVRLQFRS